MSLRGFLLVLIHLTVKPLALTGVLSKHLDRQKIMRKKPQTQLGERI